MTVRGRVVAAGGSPLAKAEVTLQQNVRSFPTLPLVYATATGADGVFVFDDVEPGQYTLNAERAGYVPGAFGQSGPMRGWTPLTVEPDRRLDDIEMALIPQAVIRGRVFDEDGEPFESVQVSLLQEMQMGPEKHLAPRPGRQEVTNDEGEFRISGVAPGKYFLQAVVDRERRGMHGRVIRLGGETAYPGLYYPDVWDPNEAQTIDVAMGARLSGFELHMRPARGYRVHGRIEWPRGAVLERCHMHLHPKRAGGWIRGGGGTMFAGETFDYDAVLPGQYVLSAAFNDNQHSRHAALEFEVTDRDLDDLVLRFPSGFSVDGAIRGGNVSGLRFSLAGPTQVNGVTNDGGSFVLADVAPGTYRLHFWAIPDDRHVRTVRYGGVAMPTEAIEIGEPARMEIELGSDSAVVSGAVDPPRPGAMVRLQKNGQPMYFAPADQDGRFEIRAVAPGEYLASATDSGWGAAPPEDGVRITVEPNQRLSLTLKIE
jgi:protocatechuate 3,4-dioxygenase beta subunit